MLSLLTRWRNVIYRINAIVSITAYKSVMLRPDWRDYDYIQMLTFEDAFGQNDGDSFVNVMINFNKWLSK